MVNAITYILDNNATVQGLVGLRSGAATDYKVFPVVVFETEKAPYIVVRQSGRTSLGKNCGSVYTIDVVCYTTSYDATAALSAACINAIQAQTSATINGVSYGYMNMTNEADGEYIRDHGLYSKIITFEGV